MTKESFKGEIIEIANIGSAERGYCQVVLEVEKSEIRKLAKNPIYRSVKIEVEFLECEK